MEVHNLFDDELPIEGCDMNTNIRFLGRRPDRASTDNSLLLDDHASCLLPWDECHVVG